MNYAESKFFFEIAYGPQLDNNLRSRFLCLKDFLKKCLAFPIAFLLKACKTFFRLVALCLSALLVLITLGGSEFTRKLFVDRICVLAKDLADWILLPFAILGCFIRLILAFLIHPNFYFNALA